MSRVLRFWFIVVAVTLVFVFLYFTLPETFEAVDTRRRKSFRVPRDPKFLGKQVNQRPLLVGTWLAIVVPLASWGVVLTWRASR